MRRPSQALKREIVSFVRAGEAKLCKRGSRVILNAGGKVEKFSSRAPLLFSPLLFSSLRIIPVVSPRGFDDLLPIRPPHER